MLPILLTTYGTVFMAEIVGDKLLYTTGVLATRYRTMPIIAGMTAAFMAKMAVAVAVGKAISTLPPLLVAAVTAVNFFAIALMMWRKSPALPQAKQEGKTARAAAVSFAAIFFSEWGDLGQVTAATLAARFGFPWIVWIGAVAAMVTKGALAASIGAGVRQWVAGRVSPAAIRFCGVGLLIVLGSLSIVETLVESH